MIYEIPYQLLADCKDVNDLHRMIMENKMMVSGCGLVFPLYEVIGIVINEFDRSDVIENLSDIVLNHSQGVNELNKKIRRVLEEAVASYINEEIHAEASLKSREAVDALYHAYEPA